MQPQRLGIASINADNDNATLLSAKTATRKSGNPSLSSGPIFNHLVRLSIPASMGMLFNTLYNLTDFWFAGKLSADALAGVSIAGSVFFLLLAVGIGIQTGASAVMAVDVGAGNEDKVADWADHVFGLSLILSVAVAVLGWLFAEPLIDIPGCRTGHCTAVAGIHQHYPVRGLYVCVELCRCRRAHGNGRYEVQSQCTGGRVLCQPDAQPATDIHARSGCVRA